MFSSRRRRKASPEPDSSLQSTSCETPETGRRRRRISDADNHHNNNNGTTPSPTTFRSSGKKKPPSTLPTFQAGNTCNNFLLGGQFYPGKDKKRKHMRRRTIWHRIFCSSPWRVVVSTILLSYIMVWHVLVPATHALLDFGRTLSGGKNGFLHVSTLALPPLDVQRKEALQLQQERDGLHFDKQHHDERMNILEQIAPDWFHRNDGAKEAKKNDVVVEDEGSADAMASDDEAAHEQHPHKNKRRAQRSKSSDGKVEKRGTRHGPPPQASVVNATITKRTDSNNKATERKTASKDKKVQAPTANKTATVPTNKKAAGVVEGKLLRRTLQNIDTFPVQSSCPVDLPATEIKTTLVIQSSLERLWILNETCRRWKSPIIAAVHLPHGTEENHRSIVAAKKACPQLTVVTLQASHDSTEWAYPVNRLRNMALDAVQTSHILVADIDFVPSVDLDATIRSTIVEQKPLVDATEHEAMIVPAFERLPPEPCSLEHDCMMYLKGNSSFIPQTLEDLRKCTAKKECSVFQRSNNWEGHFSTRSESWLKGEWYEPSTNITNTTGGAPEKRIRTIKCFDSLRYEPYVVLRWCPVSLSTENATDQAAVAPVAPYYDERFYGYGKNKIQLISHLRFMGYHFSVLPKGFIVHNPHSDSVAKQAWINIQKEKLHEEMDELYHQFLEELWGMYKGTTDYIVQQCKRPKKKDKKKSAR